MKIMRIEKVESNGSEYFRARDGRRRPIHLGSMKDIILSCEIRKALKKLSYWDREDILKKLGIKKEL